MLEGIVVLDCSDRTGWLAGRVLADLGADVVRIEASSVETADPLWQAYNVNKRLMVLEPGQDRDEKLFDQLAARADVLIASTAGDDRSPRFDYRRLKRLNPHLVLVRITPYGTEGPRAGWRGSDIELMAAGGAMSLAGEPGSTPVRISVPQSYCWTGVQAAVGALTALNARQTLNRGQEVRVSAQASVLPALAFAPAYWDMLGTLPTRAGSYAVGRAVTGARYRAFWPCRDGFLNFIIYGGAAGRRTSRQLLEWMRERACELGALGEINLDEFNPVHATQAEIDALEAPIARFFETLSKREFLVGASRREILGYPVFTVADIAADPQLEARDFWFDLKSADGAAQRHCGSFYLVDGQRPPLRHAPGSPCVREDFPKAAPRAAAAAPPVPGKTPAGGRALDGVKVLEFGGYAAGPQIGKILANFGATVVHVESPGRPDGFRLEYPPFKDNQPGLNRGGCFSIFNDSKYAVTVDVKKPGGIDLARRMTGWADIVIENMRPGVMARLGLGYEALSRDHADLVMLSTCNMGQTGPRAMTPGFGSQLSALAGFCHLTGAADGPPMLLYGPYIDFVAANFGAAAVLAALHRSRETGRGARIDLSQYEAGLLFTAGALFEYHAHGGIAGRVENADPAAAPHGAYRCRGDGWLALSCWSDAEFAALAGCMDQPGLARDERFAGLKARKRNEAALNGLVAQWCLDRDPQALAAGLQEAGVHAYPVNTVADVFSDPQLHALKSWRWRRHPEIGLHAYLFPPFDLCDTPGDVYNPAPLFGGDNDVVFREFLGLGESELAELRKEGIV